MDRFRSKDLVEILRRHRLEGNAEVFHRWDLEPHQRILRRRQLDQLALGIVEGGAHRVQAVEQDLLRSELRRRPVGIALARLLRPWRRDFAPLTLGIAHLSAQRRIMGVTGGFVGFRIFGHALL